MMIHPGNWSVGVPGVAGRRVSRGLKVGAVSVGLGWDRYERLGSRCCARRLARRLKLTTPNMPELKREAEENWR